MYDNSNGETTNGTYKEYTVRVANNTTPTECTREDFSQTACGFVVEFADVVEKRSMNSTDTNVGGWPATEMRTYANSDFLNKLPSELQKIIIDTKVISGHGINDTSNFTSTDKIYLLSTHEVWEDGTSNQVLKYDTVVNNTRQLDYYANLKVTTSSYSGAIKKYNGSNPTWWLRGTNSNYTTNFLTVNAAGDWNDPSANNIHGYAPAFRIG